MVKRYLACEDCGHVQCVKADEVWHCGSCKKRQLVDERAVRHTDGRGKRLLTCRECGHVQSVGVEVWMCTKCHETQPALKAAAPARGVAKKE